MKRIILSATAAVLLAGPALAQSQIEAALDVEPGVFSTSELAALTLGRSHETGDGARVVIERAEPGMIVSTSNQASSSTEYARRHFAQDHETGDGGRYGRTVNAGGSVVFSSSNSDLTAFAKEKLHNDEHGDN